MSEDHTETMGGMFDRGLKLRREVLGAEYVDNSLKSANEFMMAFQHITTEWCWGYAWGRPGLDKKTRSMINLAMLTALGKAPEIKLHVRGAINNGLSVDDIKEVLLHATLCALIFVQAIDLAELCYNSQAHHAFAVERRFPELTANDRDVAGLGESGRSPGTLSAQPAHLWPERYLLLSHW